ncbi:hypothetical protein ACZ90_61230 [Streptomyces albus subsp. albus]|nr:hypothetical protein ACZ90_61230 [Streptomyces albus subsp. albus]
MDFVNAVLDAVVAIAGGGAAGVPKMIEGALAASIPLLIGFLASLLGIGNLASKVKSVFHAVARPVNRAIDKIVDFIAKKGKALWQKLKPGKSGAEPGTKRPVNGKDPVRDKDSPSRGHVIDIIRSIDVSRKFTSFGHVHTIRAKGEPSGRLRTTLASEEEDFKKKVRRVISVLQTYPAPRKIRNVPPGDMTERLNTSIASARRLQESFGAWKALEQARATPDPSAANRIKTVIDAWIASGSPEVVEASDIPRPTLPPGFNKHREVLYEGDGNRFKRAKIAVIGRDFPAIFDEVQAAIKPFKDARDTGTVPPDQLRILKTLAANRLRDMTMLGASKDEARVPVKVLREFKRKGDVNGRNMRSASNWNVDHIVPLAAHWHAVGYNSDDKPRVDATPEISNLQLIAGDANKSAQADYEGVKYEFMKKKPGPDFKTDKMELQ